MPEELEHIEAGDKRYDGFRITELWVACGVDEKDNQEGVVYYIDPEMEAPAPLMAADERRLEHFVKNVVDNINENIDKTPYKEVVLKHFRLVEPE